MYNNELADKEQNDCPKNDCNGKLQEFEPIKVSLPTPRGEMRLGGKNNPNYSTKVDLPFKYCNKCRQVFYPEQ